MPNGEKSVAEMKKIIESGSSVSYHGRIITDVRDLPQPHEAAGTLEEKEAARDELKRKIDDLQEQHDMLERDIEVMKQTQAEEKQNQPPKGAGPTRQPHLAGGGPTRPPVAGAVNPPKTDITQEGGDVIDLGGDAGNGGKESDVVIPGADKTDDKKPATNDTVSRAAASARQAGKGK